jgi:hypothetical protein
MSNQVLPVPRQEETKHMWSTAPHNFLKSHSLYQFVVLASQDNSRIYCHDTHTALLIQVLAVSMSSKGPCAILPSMPSSFVVSDSIQSAHP